MFLLTKIELAHSQLSISQHWDDGSKKEVKSKTLTFAYLKNKIMVEIHPQFLTDSAGKKLVVFSQSEFVTILEELEDLEIESELATIGHLTKSLMTNL